MRFSRILTALVIAVPATAAAAGAIEIRHDPVRCVPAGRYARITAAATPAEKVARAELQFRVRSGGEWYSILMAPDAGAWAAMLPRPNPPLSEFEYRLVMTAADLSTAETEAVTIGVVEDVASCAGGRDSSVSVAAPIVIRVPAGAPVMPPVPPGFSPAGVVEAQGPKPRDKWRAVKWIAGAGAAAGIGALAAGAGSGSVELPAVSEFRLSGTAPNPGSEFSLSRDRMSVFVEVSGEPRASLTFTWFFGLRPRETFGEACVTMTDTTTIGPERPVTVELSGMLRRLGFCATSFESANAKLTIVVDGQIVREVTQELPFRIVP